MKTYVLRDKHRADGAIAIALDRDHAARLINDQLNAHDRPAITDDMLDELVTDNPHAVVFVREVPHAQ